MTDRLIFGKISCIRKQSWTVDILDPPEKLTFRCTFSLNAKKGDIYYGYLKKEGEIWTASTLPMIKISFSDQNIQEMIHKGLRCARGALDWKYAHIQSRAELLGYNSVQEYIDETIASYRRVPDEDILEGIFPGEKKENVLRFFRDWDALMLRRFEVLGIEKKELLAINRPPSELYKLIFENPLKVPEIDITRAKEILKRMSRAVVPIEEFYGLLLREVHQNLVSGHAYMDSKSLEAQFPDLDGELIKGFGLCWDKTKGRIYMQSVYEKNKRLAIYLVTRMQTQCPIREINEEIKSPNLTEEQERGLRMALTSPLSIITGRGGCGKSTLIGEIYKQEGDCMLMSFTGKAVSKLSEITGDNAPSTIHKVISKFEVKKTTKHIVVDEASMANTELILGLFETFPYPAYNFRITFVGDPNQLPPISWGAFFEQVISTSQIPTTHLTTNLRVVKAENDGICSSTLSWRRRSTK